MKKVLFSLAACALAFSSFAIDAKSSTKKTIHCAVMTDNVVNIAVATKTHNYKDYKGRRYFFCCGDCPGAFTKNPAKFSKSESIKTPKPAKKK